MDRKTPSPDNNSTGRVNQGKIVIGFLLKADQKLMKMIEKGMGYFHVHTYSPRYSSAVVSRTIFSNSQ